MINLFDVTSAHRQTTEITFDMLTSITIEKACDEWNFCINSERSLIEDMLKQAKLDKREELANTETKDDDDVDDLKYNADDSPPYTPTVKNYSSELHDSRKTLTRSLNTLKRKRKIRDRYKINPLNASNSERINIPHLSVIGPYQYGKAKQLLDFTSIPSMSQDNTDGNPSNGFTQMLDESHENEMSDNVEKIVFLQSNNCNNNVEMVSKVTTDSNYIIANNKNNKDNDMEIDTGLIVNSNNNMVESSDVKDRSKMSSKENIKDNDVVVKDNDDNDMDTSVTSKPPGEEVILHNDSNIIPMNNIIHGRFPTDFQPLIHLK